MVDDFAYINARIAAMRSRLLGRNDFLTFLSAGSFGELLALLGKTPCGPYIQSSATEKSGLAAVEEGLRLYLSASLEKLLRISSGHARKLIVILLGRWEIQSLKAVLRGQHRQRSLEQIMADTIPAGRLDEAALRELSLRGNIRETAVLLRQWGHPAGRPLLKALQSRPVSVDIQHLEYAVDGSYFSASLADLEEGDGNSRTTADFLRRRIDVTNILSALRLSLASSRERRAEEAFLDGGASPDRRRFLALASMERPESVVHSLGDTPTANALKSALDGFSRTGNLSLFERPLEELLVREAVGIARRDPLGIGASIGYICRKTVEAAHLRLVSRGLYRGLPAEGLEALLS